MRHDEHGEIEFHDEDEAHILLRKHFLYGLEAMSLMNRIT